MNDNSSLKITITKALSLLNQQQKKKLRQWFWIAILGSLLQAFGVISIMPFVALMSDPSLIQDNQVFLFLYELLGSSSYNQFLLAIGLGTISIFVLSSAYSIFEVWYGFRLFNQLESELSIRLFKGYAFLDYAFFLRQNQSEAIRRVTQEVEIGIVDVVITSIEIFSSILLALIIIIFLTYVNPWVALISGSGLFFAHLWIDRFIGKKIVYLGRHFTRLNDRLLNTASELFSGIKEIKISAAETRFVQQYADTYKALSKYSTLYGVLEYTPREIMESITYISIVLFSIFAIVFYQTPETVFPLIALYTLAAYRLIPAAREIFTGIEKIHLSEYSLSKLSKDFEQIKTTSEVSNITIPIPLKQDITLKNICFSYQSETQAIFKNFNTIIKAGHHTLISGPSGIGKTTLADIIMGLLDVSSGEIIVDGTVIKKDMWKSWRNSIGYVPQSIFLFQGSITQNVAIAEEESKINLDRVKHCCEIAQISTYIESLKNNYQTILGQGNQLLSGGQLKRLGIARALYKNPSLLILDESTNEMEDLKKEGVLSALKIINNLTVLIISHDQKIASQCDQIIKL
ncbi:MAG: ABC transporter ATP-binding protein [Pseudomonadota bacterium]